MKRLLITAALIACSLAIVRTPLQSATGALTIEQLIDIRHPSSPMWSPDGRHVVFVWDRAGVSKVYVSDLSGAPNELKDAGATLGGAFWSADGRALMVPANGDLWRVPIDGGARTAVWTTTDAEQNIVPSPDVRDARTRRDLFGRSARLQPSGCSDHEGKVRSVAASVVTRRHSHRVRCERARSLRDAPPVRGNDQRRSGAAGDHEDHDGTRHEHRAAVVAGWHTTRVPAHRSSNSADLYVIDVKEHSRPVRLTDSIPAAIDRSLFVALEMVHYTGPDGQQVPAWLFVPKNLDRSKKHPAIVWIHGDGVNQNYDGWHVQRNYAVYYSFHQYLLQKGYVVIAPDYRGSIGYGRVWREGVYMDVGGNDAKDAWMAANYLKTLNYVDTDRIGVWGLSYGGFFTLIAVTDQPKLFRAAVDVAGVVDYAMYYEDPYHGGWTTSRIGTPDQNPRVYAQASPLSHVDRLERPLLVLHGTADVNVPYLHSVRLIDELMKKGKGDLVSFMTYPGEFHYFTREHVLRDAWHRVDDFFGAHLKSGSVTSH